MLVGEAQTATKDSLSAVKAERGSPTHHIPPKLNSPTKTYRGSTEVSGTGSMMPSRRSFKTLFVVQITSPRIFEVPLRRIGRL